ncbi:MAG: DUF1127 domain-containing protein [Rhodospirillales bacterium]|nr:DUF1127 domain-containing protein [Rhodospirillales bacterium]
MTQFHTVSQADIEAGIARGRQLRSRYLAERAQRLAEALTKALIRHYRRREISRHLDDLPDYLLKDIGIARTQIPAVAAGALKRPTSSFADTVRQRLGSIFGKQPVAAGSEANDRRRLAA